MNNALVEMCAVLVVAVISYIAWEAYRSSHLVWTARGILLSSLTLINTSCLAITFIGLYVLVATMASGLKWWWEDCLVVGSLLDFVAIGLALRKPRLNVILALNGALAVLFFLAWLFVISASVHK